ncbi:MAG TPA: hypothetical protein VG944_21965 [Fimbriimonas sp.]|nr:hypothetical protein [Fimbriimonas sp.]
MANIDGKAKFLETLNTASQGRRAVAVYADADDFQSYEVGFVEHADQEEVVLLCLTPRGEPDGRRAIRTDDVARVDVDTTYTKKLELLYEYRETIFDKDFRPAPAGTADLRAQLEHAKETHTLVHLVDSNDYGPSGFVQAVGDDFVEILRIGSNGEPDGVASILSASICKVHFARRQEQLLEFLYRYNFELKRLLNS